MARRGRPPQTAKSESSTMNNDDMNEVGAPAITDTPEFQSAVETAVVKALAAMGAINQKSSGDGSIIDALVHAMATLNSKVSGSLKPVSPEIERKWKEAHARMIELLKAAYENGEKPLYTLTCNVFLNEELVYPRYQHPISKRMEKTVIYWPDIPNENMIPHNEIAGKIHAAYMESIGEAPVDAPPLTIGNWGRSGNATGNMIVRGASNPGDVSDSDGAYNFVSAKQSPTELRVWGTVADPVRIGIN